MPGTAALPSTSSRPSASNVPALINACCSASPTIALGFFLPRIATSRRAPDVRSCWYRSAQVNAHRAHMTSSARNLSLTRIFDPRSASNIGCDPNSMFIRMGQDTVALFGPYGPQASILRSVCVEEFIPEVSCQLHRGSVQGSEWRRGPTEPRSWSKYPAIPGRHLLRCADRALRHRVRLCRRQIHWPRDQLARDHARPKPVAGVRASAVKLRCRAGMGLCQGRSCQPGIVRRLANARGCAPSAIEPFQPRFPVRPVSLDELVA